MMRLGKMRHIFINRQTLLMIGLSYKQKCNNFGYHSSEVQSKGNDSVGTWTDVRVGQIPIFLDWYQYWTDTNTDLLSINVGQIFAHLRGQFLVCVLFSKIHRDGSIKYHRSPCLETAQPLLCKKVQNNWANGDTVQIHVQEIDPRWLG